MADKLTPEELDAIEKAHIGILGGRDPNGDSEILNARIRCAFDCNQNGAIAHAHRAALLQHVEALEQEVDRLNSPVLKSEWQELERKLARLVDLLSAERKALKDVEQFGGYGFDEVYLDAKRDTDYMLEALTNTATGEGK